MIFLIELLIAINKINETRSKNSFSITVALLIICPLLIYISYFSISFAGLYGDIHWDKQYCYSALISTISYFFSFTACVSWIIWVWLKSELENQSINGLWMYCISTIFNMVMIIHMRMCSRILHQYHPLIYQGHNQGLLWMMMACTLLQRNIHYYR